MYKIISLTLGILTCMSASTVVAQGDMTPSLYKSRWGVNAELINFDPDIAAASGISDSGFGIGVGYAGEKGLFNFNIGASFFIIDDEDEFSQRVENDWTGDESTEDSSIDAGSIYIDGGIQLPLSESGNFVLGLNAGYRYFDIDRGITYCSDCYSENVDIESTTYLKPFARFGFSDAISGTLAYYSYNGDKGADNSLQFSVDWNF